MSAWSSSSDWRPPQVGIFTPAEIMPALVCLAPCVAGVLLIVAEKRFAGAWQQQLDHFGLFGGSFADTLLWAPVWGFPAIAAGLLLRLVLLKQGWFGWASALIAGAIGGIAVPAVMGSSLWLAGPLYGAFVLWLQQVIYKAQYADTFGG